MSKFTKIEIDMDCDYVIIETGYTSRLEKHIDKINSALKKLIDDCAYDDDQFKLILIYDHDYTYIHDNDDIHAKDILNLLKNEKRRGSIVFKCDSLDEGFDIVRHALVDLYYCYGLNGDRHFCNLVEYIMNDTKCLLVKYDCESG